jgi:hypothetical protein
MVVTHRDPDGLGEGARGAIEKKWSRWREADTPGFVPRHLEHTDWQEMFDKLAG